MSNIYAPDVEHNHGMGGTGLRPELTYVPDTGSDHPTEEMMEPSGSSIDAMTQAMRRAKARLALVAPKGGFPSVSWEHRLTTYGDGTESVSARWTAAVHMTGTMLACAHAETLDAAVLRCVAALVEQRQAFRESSGADAAGTDALLADIQAA